METAPTVLSISNLVVLPDGANGLTPALFCVIVAFMQIFYIHAQGGGYLINDGTAANTLLVSDQASLALLSQQLQALLDVPAEGGASVGVTNAISPLSEATPARVGAVA